jgi:hypothetical protein
VAGLRAILSALALLVWRDLRKLHSITANNFFLFGFLLLGQGGAFLQLILGLLLLFPLSADPMRKIPPERLGLFPLDTRQRVWLRIASIWLSPATWIIVALLIRSARPILGLQLLALVVVFQGVGLAGAALLERAPQANLLHLVPALPGPLGELVQKNLREMLRVLDPYPALLLSVSALIYRVVSKAPEPDAFLMVTMFIVLALSTYAQCLFALDADSAFTRYRLLPLRGWQILAAKDAAFLLVVLALSLSLAPLAGLAAGLAALAIGHHQSVMLPIPQAHWRFTGGAVWPHGVMQTVAIFGAGVTTFRVHAWIVVICAVVYGGSLWWYGRALERHESSTGL